MGNFFERLGYPRTAWRRPILWSVLLLFLVLQDAVTPSPFVGGRVMSGFGIVIVTRYTFQSWRRHHHQPLLPPLGRVEWPKLERTAKR